MKYSLIFVLPLLVISQQCNLPDKERYVGCTQLGRLLTTQELCVYEKISDIPPMLDRRKDMACCNGQLVVFDRYQEELLRCCNGTDLYHSSNTDMKCQNDKLVFRWFKSCNGINYNPLNYCFIGDRLETAEIAQKQFLSVLQSPDFFGTWHSD